MNRKSTKDTTQYGLNKSQIISSALLLFGFLLILPGVCIPTQGVQGHPLLKVLDINVWSGLDYIGTLTMGEYESDAVREKRYQALLQQIRELDPDVMGVHEANKLPGYAKRLADDIGFAAFYHVAVGGVRLGPVGLPWNLREGDAILVKKKLNPEFVGRRQLSGGYVGKWITFHFADATQVLAIRITIDGTPLYIYATHWHASLTDAPAIMAKAELLVQSNAAYSEEYQALQADIKTGAMWRLSEAEKTIAFIQETAGDNPYILMGDFNAESHSKEIQVLTGHGMIDTFARTNAGKPGLTWDPATNLNQQTHYLGTVPQEENGLMAAIQAVDKTLSNRIDYIFVGPGEALDSGQLTIKDSRVVMKKIIDGVHASDHYGIYSELIVNSP
jgi:endonuclease/exonuclease/phosphatase family metal-dependent hydrolase